MSGRRKLFIAAGVELAVIAVTFIMFATLKGGSAIRARKTLVFLVMAAATVASFAPLFAAERAARGGYWGGLLRVLEPAGWVLGVSLAGPLLLALFYDRGALAAWLLAVLVAAGAGLAGAGLVLALARLTRRPLLATALGGLLLLIFTLQPLYTKAAIDGVGDRPHARGLLIASGFRPPWMAAAYTMNRAKPVRWEYVPHRSPSLYNRWVGMDYGFSIPGPSRYLLEYLAVAAGLAALAALRRGRTQSENQFIQREDIQFEGNQENRNVAITALDKVLREQEDLGAYGNLSGGLEDVTKDMNIKIEEEDNHYSIDIYPKSNTGGHDFSFTIDKTTGQRSDVAVGEILPPPDFDK